MRKVTIVGVGRVGGAFAIALARAGFDVSCLVSNDTNVTADFAKTINIKPEIKNLEQVKSIESDFLFVTTQDSRIKEVAGQIARLPGANNGIAIHASGALSSGELNPLRSVGWSTGSLHPLISISNSKTGAAHFDGAYFAVEGEKRALETCYELASSFGGRPFSIDKEQKTLYHAAAVVACGHLVALLETARTMLVKCDLDNETARDVLMPLVASTLENYALDSPENAITGPFARGDVETVKQHLEKIRALHEIDIEKVYKLLGMISASISTAEGAGNERIKDIQEIILLD